jgi:hypothetical protein
VTGCEVGLGLGCGDAWVLGQMREVIEEKNPVRPDGAGTGVRTTEGAGAVALGGMVAGTGEGGETRGPSLGNVTDGSFPALW